MSRGEAVLFLNADSAPVAPVTLVLHVDDVNAVHAEWTQTGAILHGAPVDMPWGIREFTVEDNNGHRFRISQPSREFHLPKRNRPEALQIIERIPTPIEHRALVEAVGWTAFTNYEAAAKSLPQSLHCLVAELDGQLVGMCRVIGDGQQFFYVMDVAVLPDHQGCGIGTALMNQLVDYVKRTAPPKALIGLFTGAHRSRFYERFGFRGSIEGLHGMSTVHLRQA